MPKLEHPFLLAPMAGITHSPFRRLMRGLGSSVMISELVSANGIEYAGAKSFSLLKFSEDERPVGLQIFGEREDLLVKAAQVVQKLGADFVDLNLGCPVPKIVKKGAGSAMCRDPENLCKILTSMVAAVTIPVTIKIRTGWDAQSINVHEVVDAGYRAGVAWVAIHGRTRAQGYSGEADWELIRQVKNKAKLPIIGNGDIATAAQAVERLKTSGVDAVMIGRGALRNPFIFRQCLDLSAGRAPMVPTSDDYLELLEKLRIYLIECFGIKGASIQSRKFLSWFSSGFPGCHEFRKHVFSGIEDTELWTLAMAFFKEKTSGRDLSFMEQPFLMGGHG